MSLPDNLNYLFNKKYYKEYSKKELKKHFCDNYCCDMYENPCENCKNTYQEWSSNYIFEENELEKFKSICDPSDFVDFEGGIDNEEALKSEFFEKMWPTHSMFFEKPLECQKSCANGNNIRCGGCLYFSGGSILFKYQPKAAKTGICQECFENYMNRRKWGHLMSPYGFFVDDLFHKMNFNNCHKCRDVICPHYFSRMNSVCDHCNFVDYINKKYQLDKYVVNLIQNLELKFMPGGEGALEALKSFNSSNETWNKEKEKDIKK